MSKCRGFCFTINNHTTHDEEKLQDIIAECSYCVYGREVGENGTPHLQGFIYFKNARSFKSVKTILPRAHLERMKGTPKEASDYCKKDGVFYEHGVLPQQGRRTDLDAVCAAAATGVPIETLATTFPSLFVKYPQGLSKLVEYSLKPPSTYEKTVYWLVGHSGAGKTRYVFDHHPATDIWRAPFSFNWFNGYCGQPVALFDDFRPDWPGFTFTLLLALIDRYPLKVPVKGSFVSWQPQTVYFTSVLHPKTLLDAIVLKTDENLIQLQRRITEIREIIGPDPESSGPN